MNGTQLMILSGVLVMAGVTGLVWWLSPALPDLADALDRISPRPARRLPATVQTGGAGERVGLWVIRRLPGISWLRTPTKDLLVLRKSVASYYGDKVAFVGLAVIGIPLAAWVFSFSFQLPLTVPAVATVAGAVGAWFLPDLNVRQGAARARVQFRRALGSYVDLVALERQGGGSGSRQAMELAAEVADCWPFRRISEELACSRFSGQQPWDALHHLADDLGIPDLDDLADIMRLCGEEGAPVYDTLRARAAATRHALLAADQTKANEIAERMFVPASLTAMVFLAIVILPAISRLLL
jgi:hypothetical protein